MQRLSVWCLQRWTLAIAILGLSFALAEWDEIKRVLTKKRASQHSNILPRHRLQLLWSVCIEFIVMCHCSHMFMEFVPFYFVKWCFMKHVPHNVRIILGRHTQELQHTFAFFLEVRTAHFMPFEDWIRAETRWWLGSWGYLGREVRESVELWGLWEAALWKWQICLCCLGWY